MFSDARTTILTNVGDLRFQHKPHTKQELASVAVDTSSPQYITLGELSRAIFDGRSIRISATNGMTDDGFICSQLFGLDFDNANVSENQITLTEAVQTARDNGFCPFVAYHTMSHSQAREKFRLLFVIDRPVETVAQWRHILRKLVMLYPSQAVDAQTLNPSRIFFGTNSQLGAFTNFTESAFLSSQDLLSDYTEIILDSVRKPRTGLAVGHERVNADMLSAIRVHDVNYLRTELHYPQQVFDTQADFWHFLYQANHFSALLGVAPYKLFPCIFHDDHDPSANIFRTDHGVWLYRCFGGCSDRTRTLNIKQFTELVGDFRNEYDARMFLANIFNVSVKETEETIRQRANISSIRACLYGTDGVNRFSEICPVADRNTARAQRVLEVLLSLAEQTIAPERGCDDGQIFVFCSEAELLRRFSRRDAKSVRASLKTLLYHGLILPVPNNEIPSYYKRLLVSKKYHVNIFQIPSWVTRHLLAVEENGVSWRRYGYRTGTLTFEQIYRNEPAKARELYPQSFIRLEKQLDKPNDSENARCKLDANERHQLTETVLLEMLNERGFATEKDIAVEVSKRSGMSAKTAMKRIQTSVPVLLQTYSLQKVRCTKKLKQEYGISGNGFPTIIVQDQNILPPE